MISSRPFSRPRRAPSELLRPLGASVREALRAPRRVWAFNGVLALACGLVVTEVFNVLTGRQRPVVAPRTLWLDAQERRMGIVRFRTLAWYGSLLRMVIRSRMGKNPRVTPPPVTTAVTE